MKENFGIDGKTWGRVISALWMHSADDAKAMLDIFNAASRAGHRSAKMEKWRVELMNLRSKAFNEDWTGWE